MNFSYSLGFTKRFRNILLFYLLFYSFLSLKVLGKAPELPVDPGIGSSKSSIVPFESDGEPGLWPGYDPAKVEPVPSPDPDPEQGGRLASPFILTPEKTIKKPVSYWCI